MSTEETINRGLAAFNRRDSVAFADNFADDAVVHDPLAPEPIRGREAVRADAQDFFDAFPDLHGEFIALLTTDDAYAADIMKTGTHKAPLTGPAGEIPATNKQVRVGLAVLGRMAPDGKIAEERRYYDTMGMLAQLGLTPGGAPDAGTGGSAELPGDMLT